METIILALVIFAISSLFKGNKKQEQKPMPPFNQKPPHTTTVELPHQQGENNRPRSLEDFAKEVFQQLNEKTQPMTEPVPSSRTIEQNVPNTTNTASKEEVHSKPVVSNRPAFNESRMSDRASGFKNAGHQSGDPIKGKEIGSIVPTSRTALVQAMITSEILAQPVSKRRR